MFMVLSSQQMAFARVHPVHLMNIEWRQAAADSQTKANNKNRMKMIEK